VRVAHATQINFVTARYRAWIFAVCVRTARGGLRKLMGEAVVSIHEGRLLSSGQRVYIIHRSEFEPPFYAQGL